MGNSQRLFANSGNLQELYKTVKADPHGLTMLQEKSTGKEYALVHIASNEAKDFERLKANVQKRQGLPHQHVLSVRETDSKTMNHFCSNEFRLFIMVEYPFRTLYQDIEQRRQSNNPFYENELWSILYSCSVGLGHIYSYKGRHQALSSNRIYIDKEGIIKIGDPFLLNHSPNIECTGGQGKHQYLSPEQMELLTYPRHPYSGQTSDVFTLGMVLIEAATLSYLDDLYEHSTTNINKQQLQQKLDEVQGAYGQKLTKVLGRMVKLSPKDRITLSEIESAILDDNSDTSSNQQNLSVASNDSAHSSRQARVNQVKPSKAPIISTNASIPSADMTRKNTANHLTTLETTEGVFDSQKHLYPGSIIASTLSPPYYDFTKPVIGSIPSYYQPSTYIGTTSLDNYRSIPTTTSYTSDPFKYSTNNYLSSSSSIYHQPLYFSTWKSSLNTLGTGLSPSLNTGYSNYGNYGIKDSLHYSGSYLPSTGTSIQLGSYSSAANSSYLSNTATQTTLPTVTVPLAKTVSVTHPIQLAQIAPKEQTAKQSLPNKRQSHTTTANETLRQARLSQEQKEESLSPVQQLQTPERKQRDSKELMNNLVDNQGSLSNSEQSPSMSSAYQQVASLLPNSTIAQVTESSFSESSPDVNEQPKYQCEQYEQGSRYEGYKLRGKRHGYGKFYYQDGGYYEGDWKQNKMSGFAKLFYQNGQLAYEGYWKDDMFHGKGKVFNDNPKKLTEAFDYTNLTGLDQCWIYYQGEFYEDSKHGTGIVMLSNGQCFQGAFQKDVIQGEGRFNTKTGETIHGIWRDNRLVESLQ